MNPGGLLKLALFLLVSGELWAVQTEIGPSDDLIAAANALEAGDVLILQGGTYTVTTLFNLAVDGIAGQPIVIRAKAGQTPVISRPNALQNVIDIESTHLIIDGLTFTGGAQGMNIRSASDFTLRNSEIHNTEEAGLTANDTGETYLRLLIEGNNIYNTGGAGEGMYLGCNSNTCRVAQSIIRNNWIHDTNGEGVSQGEGIDLKEGSYDNLVADNVIHDTGLHCIVAGGVVGNGERNRIERNVVWNCGDWGIQVAADALIRNNIVVAAAEGGIRAEAANVVTPSNVEISHNTVLQPANRALRLGGVTGTVNVYNNALYSQLSDAIYVINNTGTIVFAGNAGQGSAVGVAAGFTAGGNPVNDFVGLGYTTTPPGNAFPKAGSFLIGKADTSYLAPTDFNGTNRAGDNTAGAYRYSASGNPGWPLQEGLKPVIQDVFADGFETP